MKTKVTSLSEKQLTAIKNWNGKRVTPWCFINDLESPTQGLVFLITIINNLSEVLIFVLGRENGECFTYYKNGQVKIKSVYVEGVEDGTWGYWYENGQVAWGNTYKMGVKTGEWLYFQEDGKPSKTLNYEDNVFNGLQSYFHKNGKPKNK